MTNGNANDFSFGYQVMHYNYSEPGIEWSGVLQGVNGEWTFDVNPKVEGKVEGILAGGGLDYNGEPIGKRTRTITTETDDQLGYLEYRMTSQSGFAQTGFRPSGGIGYRYWSNDIQDASNAAGYLREIEYFYLPLGVVRSFDELNGWTPQFSGNILLLIDGRTTSHLSDVDSSWPNVENTQKNGKGLKLVQSFRKDTKFGQDYSLNFFLTYWNIKKSDFVETGCDIDGDKNDDLGCDDNDAVFEPANETLELGFRFLIHF